MITREEIELFEKLSANLYADAVSDILDELGYRDRVVSPHLGLRPLDPASVVVGRATTLLNDYDETPDEPYKLAIRCLDAMQPGQILVAGGTEPLPTGIFGELSAMRVARTGGRGAIINGYTRDARKIVARGFPVVCRGCSPLDSQGRTRVVDIDCPIPFGDLKIEAGQIVFADLDGIVAIPREIEDEAMRLALKRAEDETTIRGKLADGATMEEMWRKYRIL